MILTGSEIKRNVTLGRIVIEPFNENQINPNSYNYRLGETYIEINNDTMIDLKSSQRKMQIHTLPDKGIIFSPNRIYLCNTYETIGSEHYVTSLIGKSSMGRLGVFLQLSADLGHQGEIHKWTLEIKPIIPIKVYPHMIIGQVTFWKTLGSYTKSNGYYKKFDMPKESRGTDYDFDR